MSARLRTDFIFYVVAVDGEVVAHYLRFLLTDDVLLFFKHYDPKQRTLACVGHLYTPLSTKFGKLNPFFCYLQFVLLLVRSVFICTN